MSRRFEEARPSLEPAWFGGRLGLVGRTAWRVRLLLEALTRLTGRQFLSAATRHPSYAPMPLRRVGRLVWGRFDVGLHAEDVRRAWAGRPLVHQVPGGDVMALFSAGILAPAEQHAAMGMAAACCRMFWGTSTSGGQPLEMNAGVSFPPVRSVT